MQRRRIRCDKIPCGTSPAATLILIMLAASPSITSAQGMRDALAAAWERHPTARALSARQDEFTARHEAADSLRLAHQPPACRTGTIACSATTAARMGGRITLPLWLPGYQARTLALIEREQSAFTALVAQSRWKLAGEVREAWWQAMLAANERDVARAHAESTRQLASDVERRVRAGDLPRMDANQARSAEAAAEGVLAETDGQAHRAARTYLALTGQPALPAREGMHEQRQKPDPISSIHRSWRRWSGPSLLRARPRSPPKNVRDLPELTFGMRRASVR